MNRFIQWIKGVWTKVFRRKNHKLVLDSKCKDRCSCLCVYNEKNESDDDSGSDITISPTEIKVK